MSKKSVGQELPPFDELPTGQSPRWTKFVPEIVEPASKLIEAAMAKKHPELHSMRAPAGYVQRGVSTLNRFNDDGTVTSVLQWTKTTREPMDVNQLVELVKGAVMSNPIPAAPKAKKIEVATSKDLEVLIATGDPHFGMLSWDKETGDNWDVQIAREVHTKAIQEALRIAPASSRLMLLNLGDAIHSDGFKNETTAGTRVDTDSRWPKVIEVFVETINLAIIEGLKKHDHVEVINARGNHDNLSSVVIRMIMAERWRNNPRVTIAQNNKMMWYHKFGNNLLSATHGDKAKMNNLPAIVAHDAAEYWGNTKHRFLFCGHFHSRKLAEYPGIEVEYFRTLASHDAWSAGQGYRAKRSLRCDVFHKIHGRTMMHEIGVDQIIEEANKK